MISSSFKSKLLSACMDHVNQRIRTAQQAMQQAQDAANEETKGTMGDKHETSRAMMHIERDKSAKQLDEAFKLKIILEQMDISSVTKSAVVGSVVFTDNGCFFLSIGAGKINADDIEVIAIGAISPLAQLLLNKKEGDAVNLNNHSYLISKIF